MFHDEIYMILLQLLSSLRVILSLPPLSSASHKSIRDIYRQVASGMLELLQAHSSDLQTCSEWSIIFSVMEFAGSGLSLYTSKEDAHVVPSSHVSLEGVSMDTRVEGVGVASETAECSPEEGDIQSDWVWVEEAWHAQLILPNSFDLISKELIPVFDSQVSLQLRQLNT